LENRNTNENSNILATGSNPKIWEMLQSYGHIVNPVPLYLRSILKMLELKNCQVAALATVKVKDTKLESTGPLLITHWGMSGPAVLKLSAWGESCMTKTISLLYT
jgi:predicted flavoprotein YhiN